MNSKAHPCNVCDGINLSEICARYQHDPTEEQPVCVVAYLAAKNGIPFIGTLAHVRNLQAKLDEALGDLLYNKDTGALTKQAFVHKINERLISRRKEDDLFTFVELDLDRFKEVNDKFSHLSGNLVLASLGNVAKKRIREHDLFGRLGGDEFGIFFEGASEEEVLSIMEEIRDEFSHLEFPFNDGLPRDQQVHPSFSFGMATCDKYDMMFYELYIIADKLMYEEKERRKSKGSSPTIRT